MNSPINTPRVITNRLLLDYKLKKNIEVMESNINYYFNNIRNYYFM